MSTTTIHVLATGSAVALLLLFDHLGRKTASLLAKTVASLLFVHLAYATGAWASSPGQAVFVALCFGLVGDVGLGLGRRGFVVGLAAFFIGHLALLAALILRGGVDVQPALFAVAALVLPILKMQGLLRKHAGRLAIPAMAYMLVISLALILAAGSYNRGPLVLLGVVLFWISDVFVARRRFWAPGPWNRRLGLPLYYAGQLLLATQLR